MLPVLALSSQRSLYLLTVGCVSDQELQPNLDELQAAVTAASQMIVEVSRGIAQWGQKRYLRIVSVPPTETSSKDIKHVQQLHHKGTVPGESPAAQDV